MEQYFINIIQYRIDYQILMHWGPIIFKSRTV